MTSRGARDARLTAHNDGVLSFLLCTRVKPPPKGRTIREKAFRAGWMSAKAAMEGGNA